MRIGMFVIGLVLLLCGAAVFFGAVEYPHDTHSVQIGNFSASVTREKSVPQWIGAVGAIVGIVLLAGGAMRK